MLSYKNSRMLEAAGRACFKPKPIIQILLFAAVFMVGNAAASMLLTGPMIIGILTDPEFISNIFNGNTGSSVSAAMSVMEKPWIMLASLFATAATTVICLVYCCKIEKRPIVSVGFTKSGWLGSYLKGYVIGTAMLFLCALILWLMGDLDFAVANNIPVIYILLFFVGFVIQGMSEEVLVRGYFMVSLANRCHVAIAVGISSAAFALLHIANPGISLPALLNLTLYGVFMAVYVLRTDNLWGACAIHSAWNFAQGNLVGISVSGNAQMPTVAIMKPIGESALFHGGDFGLEGGLIVTFVLLAAILLTVFLPKKEKSDENQI